MIIVNSRPFFFIIGLMKALSNFHTHTYLCGHAEGKPVDYALQAQKEGCKGLGFSDHCPFPKDFPDPWQNVRMDPEQVPLYKQMIDEARKEVDFPLYMGFECEWDPVYESWYRDELRGKFGAQYLVLGQHWIMRNGSHPGTQDIRNDQDLNMYAEQLISGMKSGLFDFLAHPDLFMFSMTEWTDNTKAVSQAIIDAAVDLNMPLEVNGYGLAKRTQETSRGIRQAYPYVEFWELAAASKARIICNSDAHFPNDVIFNAWRARDFAGRFGINVQDFEISPKR